VAVRIWGMDPLAQLVLLLGIGVLIILFFHRFRIPSTIGYLLVGVILGPGTGGPVVDQAQITTLAEFGIVFLLFTIGLNYSLPELGALQRRVPSLGIGQIVFTVAVISVGAWAFGLAPAVAFVIGAVFAQSSSTIIAKQLSEQGEETSRAGRLGLAMSVFQDVTAVPFIVIIPVLGAAVGIGMIAGELGLAIAKAALAVLLVLVAGRWLLRPLLRIVARQRSAEIFTLTVLFVVLAAAWTTDLLGLSLAFGAFLAGMTLGESEFRHQVEASIKPFRDVLLGLFFVAIGMLIDFDVLPDIILWAILGTVSLLVSKIVIVTILAKVSGMDMRTAVRMGLILAVGGEFGLALLAIALNSGTISLQISQIGFTSVLLSMLIGAFLIRFNKPLAQYLTHEKNPPTDNPGKVVPISNEDPAPRLKDHVIIGGYGRIGQSVAHLLDAEGIPYVAVDLDAVRVREAHAAGDPVFYGDLSDPEVLRNLGVDRARLVLIGHDDNEAALRALSYLKSNNPDIPVVVRTRDITHVEELHDAGALEVVAEKLEAGLSIASQVLLLLDTPGWQVMEHVRQQRARNYPLLQESFLSSDLEEVQGEQRTPTHVIQVPRGSLVISRTISELEVEDVRIFAIFRSGERISSPDSQTSLKADDVVIARGNTHSLERLEEMIVGHTGRLDGLEAMWDDRN
jgi:CPA2 family monovalent cation:H+ antiporter-2